MTRPPLDPPAPAAGGDGDAGDEPAPGTWKPATRGTPIMAKTAKKTRTYRIRREWTVVMESWIEVEADSVEAACREARADDDYDDQRIADDSDGQTYIGRIECDDRELPVPAEFNGDGMR